MARADCGAVEAFETWSKVSTFDPIRDIMLSDVVTLVSGHAYALSPHVAEGVGAKAPLSAGPAFIRNGTEALVLPTGLRHRSVAAPRHWSLPRTRALVSLCPHSGIGPCLALRHWSLPAANVDGLRSGTSPRPSSVARLSPRSKPADRTPQVSVAKISSFGGLVQSAARSHQN
jgi:hypothetical protein